MRILVTGSRDYTEEDRSFLYKKLSDSGVHICLAFPKGQSRGTRGCAKMAMDAQVPTIVFEYATS